MSIRKIFQVLALASLCDAREFFLDANQNTACLGLKAPTSIKITRTLGQEPLPIILFNYLHRNSIPGLPNFDFLTTDAKLEDYYQFGEFTFPKLETVFAFSDVLKQNLSYDVDFSGLWCVYAPKNGSYEYKVEVPEPGYFEKYDDIWYCIINIVVSVVVMQLFYFTKSKRPVLFTAVTWFQLCKVGVFATTALFAVFNSRILPYAENTVFFIDQVFTMLFLMGYGLKTGDDNVKKIVFVILLTVVPSFVSRYFDFKSDEQFLSINNRTYNVVRGILGADGFDGLSFVQRVAKHFAIDNYSGVIALLFGVSNLIIIFGYISAIRRTLIDLKSVNPVARPGYLWTVIIWFFVWSLVSTACAPSIMYSYTNVKDYAKVLSRFMLETLRNRYITLLWDESHWIAFRFIWALSKGLLVDTQHDVEKKAHQE
ncbi:uncharacterized protein LODBEIA_P23870 [Lodderomyces beijingensis]|uniref:Intimal thickness related receptor IRP domain-containing protein n=1 Tax=Lodderomyces beijingensis TaxID=1775926 RepID=A0ABP0ZKJ2_9ASCO